MSEWTIHRRVESTPTGPHWRLSARRGADSATCAGSLSVRFDVGSVMPRHWYHLGTAMHGAPEIGVMRRQRTLTLCSDLAGATELFDLRADGDVAALLVQATMLWLAREGSAAPVFAELPGSRDAGAPAPHETPYRPEDSAFFQAIGRHFLPEGSLARQPDATHWPPHLAGLLPRHPLYADMLPAGVQAVIGRAPGEAAAWIAALDQEGFQSGRAVTVVDGGPVHEGHLNASATARSARWREAFVDAFPHAMRADNAPAGEPPSSLPAFALILDDAGELARLLPAACDEGVVTLAAPATLPPGPAWCAPVRRTPR
jgi:arginine/ornithine N-succinyltransferase beta subunit